MFICVKKKKTCSSLLVQFSILVYQNNVLIYCCTQAGQHNPYVPHLRFQVFISELSGESGKQDKVHCSLLWEDLYMHAQWKCFVPTESSSFAKERVLEQFPSFPLLFWGRNWFSIYPKKKKKKKEFCWIGYNASTLLVGW